jgi:hypothetical protein
MSTKRPVRNFLLSVVCCALVGSFGGLLWGSGAFELLSRHHRGSNSYWREMTVERYTSNLVWFPIYGFLGGIAFGVLLEIWALLNPPKDSSSEKEKQPS